MAEIYTSKAIALLDMALEWVRAHDNLLHQTVKKSRKGKPAEVQWTGDLINLVENIYGAHQTNSFNNGQIEIKYLVEYIAGAFNVEINDCYDFYYKMRIRSGSRTAFLDKMKSLLERKMERDDEKWTGR